MDLEEALRAAVGSVCKAGVLVDAVRAKVLMSMPKLRAGVCLTRGWNPSTELRVDLANGCGTRGGMDAG